MSVAIDAQMEALMEAAAGLDLVEKSSSGPDALAGETYGDPMPGLGPLLEEKDESRVARMVLRLWTSQDSFVRRRNAQTRANELRRKGYTGVVIRTGDDGLAAPYLSPSASPDVNPTLNKAATLCRRIAAVLFADPPAADPQAPSGSDGDRAAVEMTARILEDQQGPHALDTPRKLRRAFDRASSGASAFIHYFIDPKGGGRVPIEVEAFPHAQQLDHATHDPEGQPWSVELARAYGLEWDGQYAKRFVTPEGGLTEKRAEAAEKWAPALKSEVVDSRHVRLIPHTAEDAFDADGIVLGQWIAWGEAKRRWHEKLKDCDKETRDEILRWRPDGWEQCTGLRDEDLTAEGNPDESQCYALTLYMSACDDYPKGAWLIVLGGRKVVVQEPWEAEVQGVKEALPIPLAQVKQFAEGDEEPFGHGLMELVGPGNELLAAVWGSFLDYLDDLNNRKIFLPYTSMLRAEPYLARGKRIIPINQGGKPEHEQTPPYPREGLSALQMIPALMENVSGLEQVAQGLEDSSVQSGSHATAIIGQVQAGMSELKQNAERAFIRCSVIELQMIRAFYTAPQILAFTGEDGEDRSEQWMGADLVSTRDVRIKPGTMTMLSTAQKAQLVQQWQQLGLLQPHEAQSMLLSGVGAMIGAQDNPHLRRIRRQLWKWRQGPTREVEEEAERQRGLVEAWQAATQDYQAALGQAPALAAMAPAPPPPQGVAMQPQADPQTGQPMIGPDGQPVQVPGNPYAQALAEIFLPLPVDQQPDVAAIRIWEIGRVMSGTDYEKQAPEWRSGLDMEYQRMSIAMAPPPPQVGPDGKPLQQEQPRAA
jgi:hypothetical protein